ncbi:alpha/beta fold hydrolase [Microlunatus sp. Y2014]|uniref:alpha/beta fold hydrolase n=1 Tax=Microlunatus sp. Y2014 TaxID=3418488 RepID=UPI003DA7047E
MTESPAELAECPPAPTARVVQTSVSVDGIWLQTTTATPVAVTDSSPLVVTLGILATLDRFEVQRFQMLADLLGRPVVALDTPGWSMGQAALPRRVREQLSTGGFAWLARLQADALCGAHPRSCEQRPSVLGYSLGASSGSALAVELADRSAELRGLTLVEPVALQRQNLAELGWRNVSDARHSGRYAAQSKGIDWAVAPTPPRTVPRIGLGHMVWAISRGGLPATLSTLPREVPIELISGGASSLSPPDRVAELARDLRKDGHTVATHLVPDAHHALWNSLPHVAAVAKHIL